MMRKRIGIVMSMAVVGALAWWGVGRAASESRQGGQPEAPSTSAPEHSDMTAEVIEDQRIVYSEAPGVVRPKLEAQLAARVMSRIDRIAVREGDRVRAGQPLVWLDARDLDAAVSVAGAGMRSAGAAFQTAVVAHRMEAATSDARVAAARAFVLQSEAGLKAAKARLDLAQTGPRRQERAQAALSVAQAKAGWDLAEANARRMVTLLGEGAVSEQQADAARAQRDVARAQYEAAVEARSLVDEGSRSEDVRAAQEAVQQAQAGLEQARQALRQAEAAQSQVDVRRQDVRAADAQVAQARAALVSAQVTRTFSVLRAPFDGTVTRRMADPGAMAAPGIPLLAIEGGPMRLEAATPESVMRHVRTGSRVQVAIDTIGMSAVDGVVAEVSPQGDPRSHTFVVRVELPSHAPVRSGMFGRARFATGRERALLAPAAAVRERDGLYYADVAGPDGAFRSRLITLGGSQGAHRIVLSGLSAGERVRIDSSADHRSSR